MIDTDLRTKVALYGIYVIRTSEKKRSMPAAEAVRTYKDLGQVERAFRSLKTLDLQVRPIRHRSEPRVRAHIFLCMLAYYVQWHMRKALSPLLFQDDELEGARRTRDAVAKAEPSESAREKKQAKKTAGGWPVHSLASLLTDLATRCKNTCRAGEGKTAIRFSQLTELTPFQAHVFDLLGIKP